MEEEVVNEDDYSVFIGIKDTKTYVYSVVDQSKMYNHNMILIKARGRRISQAVDVALISIGKYIKDWEIKDIKLDTAVMPYRQEGEQLAEPPKEDQEVSTIRIELGTK